MFSNIPKFGWNEMKVAMMNNQNIVSIPEDDQFALAEARCDDLQDKIDLVKVLKRKRKLKRKSMTRMNEPTPVENIPFIAVRTRPKQKVVQQACNPTPGYVDPATVEQSRMLGQVRTYGHAYKQPRQELKKEVVPSLKHCKPRPGRNHADGDGVSKLKNKPFESQADRNSEAGPSAPAYRNRVSVCDRQHILEDYPEERPVVELFNKSRASWPPEARRRAPLPAARPNQTKKAVDSQFDDAATGPLEDVTPAESKQEVRRPPRSPKYRTRGYEQPTIASQMKQTGVRHYYGQSNDINIPFVGSKSTSPSHNIGVNIQQVLNGVKTQQPPSGIPLTIAHHMGLGHVPTYGTKSASDQNMSLNNRNINVIKFGPRLLRLVSNKYMSYRRLLNMYREGEGVVPRFLRSINRPHYFYTSMYKLATNREDLDGATSKGRGAGGSHEAKQSLAEYTSLYREYEKVDQCLKDGSSEPGLEQRRDELSALLAAREDYIRKVVQEYRSPGEGDQNLRASASTAEEGCRHSTFKLNAGE